jgi:pimeloyl-ACP methyl ester carboxylesterase
MRKLLLLVTLVGLARPALANVCINPKYAYALQYAGPHSHMNAPKVCGPNDMCNLNGWLYLPSPSVTNAPAIVYIQGSGAGKNQADLCAMLHQFLDAGYVVWVPYLRGYNDTTADVYDASNNPVVTGTHPGNFSNSGTYIGNEPSSDTVSGTVDLMNSEIDNEIQWSFDWLKNQPSGVAAKYINPGKVVLAGHSYGGITVTLAAKRWLTPLPAAIIDMSGGVLGWPSGTTSNGTFTSDWAAPLCDAAQYRRQPMLITQTMNESRFFYSGDLGDAMGSAQTTFICAEEGAYVNGNGGAEMSLFTSVPNLGTSPWCKSSTADNECAHVTFVKDQTQVDRWAPQVLDFLAHYNVN